MNVREHRRIHLVNAAALVAPVLAFAIVQFGLLSDPAHAPAATSTPEQTPAPGPRGTTRLQAAALAWLDLWHEPAAWPSPMNHPAPEAAQTPHAPEPAPHNAAPQPTSNTPSALPLVSTIMGTRKGGLATLNGRVVRVGDRVGPWTVSAIDAQHRTVTLSDADGKSVDLTPAR